MITVQCKPHDGESLVGVFRTEFVETVLGRVQAYSLRAKGVTEGELTALAEMIRDTAKHRIVSWLREHGFTVPNDTTTPER